MILRPYRQFDYHWDCCHISLSYLSCVNNINSLDRGHFAIWTLPHTCKWLCAFIANMAMIEAVFTAVSVYPRASILQTYSIEVTLHFELCKTITSNFATLSPMSLPARLFHISISSFSCVKDIGITHMIEVTLQFGLCNAPTSDFAPFSPIGNLLRLLQSSEFDEELCF